jgi:hypothetical protein
VDGRLVKIGLSRSAKARLATLQTTPFGLSLLSSAYCDNVIEAEEKLHRAFASCRLAGEWFLLTEKQLARLLARLTHLASLCDQPADPGKTRIGRLVRIPRRMAEALQQLADEEGTTFTQQVQLAVTAYLRFKRKLPPPTGPEA